MGHELTCKLWIKFLSLKADAMNKQDTKEGVAVIIGVGTNMVG